ncbi:MAG TPA: methyltransferase [Alteraurantiacibacter sp.]
MGEGAANNMVQEHFSDSEAVARYAEGPPRFVPGFFDIHRMALVLLRERVPDDGRLLVLGAGGGLELNSFAEQSSGWSFVGIDPSAQMLALTRTATSTVAERIELVQGYIEDAPAGPFDGATCLLTLHFLDRGERLRILQEIRRRLSPGAPFIAAHSSFPQQAEARPLWLERYRNFAIAGGAEAGDAEHWRRAVEERLTLLSPEEDEELLRDAGFAGVTAFYAAFTWRGWVAYA